MLTWFGENGTMHFEEVSNEGVDTKRNVLFNINYMNKIIEINTIA